MLSKIIYMAKKRRDVLIAVSALNGSWVARLITLLGDMVFGSTYTGLVKEETEEGGGDMQLRQVLFSSPRLAEWEAI